MGKRAAPPIPDRLALLSGPMFVDTHRVNPIYAMTSQQVASSTSSSSASSSSVPLAFRQLVTSRLAAKNASMVAVIPEAGVAQITPLETRNDKPVVQEKRTRGCLAEAVQIANSELARHEAMNNYEAHKFAASSAGVRESRWGTWKAVHKAWFHHQEWLPPTMAQISAVASCMKVAGYRSFSNYASRAKQEHVKAGYPWTDELALEVRDATRSVTRGIGGARQSGEIDPWAVSELDFNFDAFLKHGPINPVLAYLLMALWLVRGIKAAWAMRSHITMDTVSHIAKWSLPVSKTDPKAIGCIRSWGCTCGHLSTWTGLRRVCPYHLMESHLQTLDQEFGTLENLLLFPSAGGQVVSRDVSDNSGFIDSLCNV